MIRYYLHGDPIDQLPGMFYCWPCESFEKKDHFDVCPLGQVYRKGQWVEETHRDQYLRHMKMANLDEKIKESCLIVQDANNLFLGNG